MKRRRRVFVILLACAVVGIGVVIGWPREWEPVYEGKTLTQWLLYEDLRSKIPDPHDRQTDAIRQIGSNAVPFLLTWVQYRAPASKKEMLKVLGWLPAVPGLNLEDKELERSRAAWAAFRILGPQARAAIPDLTRMMSVGRTMSATPPRVMAMLVVALAMMALSGGQKMEARPKTKRPRPTQMIPLRLESFAPISRAVSFWAAPSSVRARVSSRSVMVTGAERVRSVGALGRGSEGTGNVGASGKNGKNRTG